jgi:hypothetical protein
MMTSKRNAVIAVALALAGSIGIGLAQRGAPHAEQASAPTDEVQNLHRLLALQEQQLDLIQQQIQLTKGRIQSISDAGPELAMVEVEVQIIEIVTDEPVEFERLLGLPDPGSGFNLVLDEAKYEELFAKAKNVEGASVVTRPKVAVRNGGQAQIANLTSVPYFALDDDVEFASIGFQGRFQPTVVSEETLTMRMELEVTELVGKSTVTAPDGGLRAIPMIAGRSAIMHATLEKGQGVVRGWAEAHTGQAHKSVLYFARPRILTPEEMKGPF